MTHVGIRHRQRTQCTFQDECELFSFKIKRKCDPFVILCLVPNQNYSRIGSISEWSSKLQVMIVLSHVQTVEGCGSECEVTKCHSLAVTTSVFVLPRA